MTPIPLPRVRPAPKVRCALCNRAVRKRDTFYLRGGRICLDHVSADPRRDADFHPPRRDTLADWMQAHPIEGGRRT